MPVDPNSHVPIYEQIVEHIRGGVAAGLFRAEEPLPSVRALATELLVNPNTVQRAYQELERQGLVYTRRGLGVFVSRNGDASAQTHLEAAIVDRFREAIQLAREANLSARGIGRLFQQAMNARSSSRKES